MMIKMIKTLNICISLIVLGYDPIVEKKYPLSFILINNKNQLGYECVLKNFKDIITLGNKSKINIISYTTDFENALINAMKKNFSSCRGIRCLFHYSQALMRNIKSFGLYKKEYKLESDKLLKKLIEIPFLYYDNNNIIEDIFDEFINNNNSNKVYIQLLNNFKTYFIKEWTNYFIDGYLNCNLITKI